MAEIAEIFGFYVIVMFGLFLIGFGVVALVRPEWFSLFLSAFAQNSRVHFLEMGLRFLVGGAFLVSANAVEYENAFRAFGWLLVITTGILVIVPWRRHRKFADLVIPRALQHAPLMGITAILMGVLIMLGLSGGWEATVI